MATLAVPTFAAQQAAASPRALTLADYYRLERASAPAISPDGRWVAFVRTRIVEDENRRLNEIWLAPADGSRAAVRITSPAFNATDPRWSADGTLLAFSSSRDLPGVADEDQNAIWFLRMNAGGEAFQIPGVDGTPIFSPDNKWIAFTKAARPKKTPPPADPFERRIQERFTGRIYEWMNYRFDQFGYTPDPRDAEATPPEELYLVSRDGGVAKQVTKLGVDVQAAAWRPDSGALAITANAHQRDEHTYERADLWVVSILGDVKRITDDGHNYDSPAWAPDGRSLVVRRTLGLSEVIAKRQTFGAPVDLYRLSPEAPDVALQNLTPDWDLIPESPAWSADGRTIFLTAGSGGSSHVFRMAAGGGTVTPVTAGARQIGEVSGAWRAERIAYVVSDATHPTEVCTARTDGGGETRISRLNDALLAEVRLAAAERVSYPSRDGTSIEGWVMMPSRTDESRRPPPLVLNIHGGPHGAYGTEFSFQFQLLVAQGHAVLFTNPRGSTNYGEKFLWATWGGWGTLDYEDVMAGVDHVVGRYAVDSTRLGVTGYSYGGFLTNWIIGHTTRFRAAIVGAGISNWISDYGTADIPRTKESEFFGPPWEPRGEETLRRQSPIHYAGNVTTPTLFIHGESDFRVPIEQGEQMYTALQKKHVPARFVRYPGMFHGGWTPWNTVHRLDQELKWWAEHLASTDVARPTP